MRHPPPDLPLRGGKTRLKDLLLLCSYRHDICVHRLGWTLTLHPDGTTQARSPDGTQTLHSHGPPRPSTQKPRSPSLRLP